MLEGTENIQRSFYPQMALELILIKLSTLENIVPLEDIIKKLNNLSKKTGTAEKSGGRLSGRRRRSAHRNQPPLLNKLQKNQRLK